MFDNRKILFPVFAKIICMRSKHLVHSNIIAKGWSGGNEFVLEEYHFSANSTPVQFGGQKMPQN